MQNGLSVTRSPIWLQFTHRHDARLKKKKISFLNLHECFPLYHSSQPLGPSFIILMKKYVTKPLSFMV